LAHFAKDSSKPVGRRGDDRLEGTKFARELPALARFCGLWLATWLLLVLPDVLLHWFGYAVEAAVKAKPIVFAGVIALLLSTAKSRSLSMPRASLSMASTRTPRPVSPNGARPRLTVSRSFP
jgi:hypothetical protein